MELLEVVYEGGEILDMALAAQREILRSELRDRFVTVDLRRLPIAERARLFRELTKKVGAVRHLLIRGLSGVSEAAKVFPRARLFLDALGRTEIPERAELAPYAFRTTRVFAYSHDMDQTLRDAGVGVVSRYAGPFFPRVQLSSDPLPRPECFRIGVLNLAGGALEVLAALKRVRKERTLDFEIISTERLSGVDGASCALDVAEQADLLVSPGVGQDRLGPDEGSILALCTSKALCTFSSAAFKTLPYSVGKYIPAEKYAPGSYASAALLYPGQRAVLDAWPASVELDWRAVPQEILRRL